MIAAQVLRCETELKALEPAWSDLWRRSPAATYAQGPAYVLHAWSKVHRPAGGSLFCVVGWDQGRLRFVLPLVRTRKWLWHLLKPVGSSTLEPSGLLCDEDLDAGALLAMLARTIADGSRGDILSLGYVRSGTALARTLATGFLHHRQGPESEPFVTWGPFRTWDQYRAGLSGGSRKDLGKKARKAEALGRVAFTVVQGGAGHEALVARLLDLKRQWADRRHPGRAGPWLHSRAYEDFLVAMLGHADGAQGLTVFTLSIGDEVAAMLIAAVGRQVDWLLATYDARFCSVSPGMLLNEHCLRWAFDRGLDVAMGAGQERNKLFWSGGRSFEACHYKVALSAWGALPVQAVRLAHALRTLPGRLRASETPSTPSLASIARPWWRLRAAREPQSAGGS